MRSSGKQKVRDHSYASRADATLEKMVEVHFAFVEQRRAAMSFSDAFPNKDGVNHGITLSEPA
jgi:hypothetical protein